MRAAFGLALVVLVGCKGGGLSGAVTLADAPAPTLPPGWVTTPADVEGYSLSTPEGWQFNHMPQEDLEGFVKGMNENAWSMLDQQKADVDFAKAKAIAGVRDASIMSFFEENKIEDHMLIAIREDVGKNLSLKQAADRWRDTIRIEGEHNPPSEKTVKLPVGDAIVLSKQDTVMNITSRIHTYVLVDGQVVYTVFFLEEKSRNAADMPHKEIMDTFRVKRG